MGSVIQESSREVINKGFYSNALFISRSGEVGNLLELSLHSSPMTSVASQQAFTSLCVQRVPLCPKRVNFMFALDVVVPVDPTFGLSSPVNHNVLPAVGLNECPLT